MDCKTADEYINLYIDDMLGEKETKELLSHVESCRKCKKELDYAYKLKMSMSQMGELESPPGLAKSAIRKARRRRIPIYAYISAGAAAVVVAVVLLSSSFLGISSSPAASEAQIENKMMAIPAPMATSAPQLAYSAMAPASSAAPSAAPGASDNTGNSIMSDGLATKQDAAPQPFVYTIPPELSNFKDALLEFLNETGIQPDNTTDPDGNEVIGYTIPSAENLEALKKLVKKAHIPHESEPYVGCYVEFDFQQ